MLSPSSFMFYLQTATYCIAGASPERLVRVFENEVETMPIAGTRPRGVGEEDLRLEQELLGDEKEDAEHMMLVDVGRNDVGRVAQTGSVVVKELKKVHRFSHVMHLVSIVKGTLHPAYDALDAFKASFPAATLSGAPKIRAMEIIDLLETSRRGLYGGAICAIDNRGNLDSCIAIRMVVLQEGVATVRAGCGVVFDSDPQKEADETRHKAKAALEAIRLAEGGLV
jgi:anthranilate synthase component 1